MIFYVIAAVLAALKIAGLAAAVSWWLIVGVALIPLAIAGVCLLIWLFTLNRHDWRLQQRLQQRRRLGR